MKSGLNDVIWHAWWQDDCPSCFASDKLTGYLAGGGNPNAVYDQMSRLPHWVARFGTPEQLDEIVTAGGDVNCRSEWGYTPLFWLYYVWSLRTKIDNDRVLALLERGADINAADKDGETALHRLTMSLHPRPTEVDFLVGHVADIALSNKDGRQPIHNAAEMCQVPTVAKLVELGADINAPDNRGRTPLHVIGEGIGVWHWSERLIISTAIGLIKLGANPNQRDNKGRTVLIEYVKRLGRFPSLINALLEQGADRTIPDNDDLLPRQVALARSNRKLAALLA